MKYLETRETKRVRRVVYNNTATTYVITLQRSGEELQIACTAVFDCKSPQKIFYQLGKSVSTKFKFKEVYIQFIKEKQIGLVFKDDIDERQEEKAIGECIRKAERYIKEMKRIVVACGGMS